MMFHFFLQTFHWDLYDMIHLTPMDRFRWTGFVSSRLSHELQVLC